MPTIQVTSDYTVSTPLSFVSENGFVTRGQYPAQGPTIRINANVDVRAGAGFQGELHGVEDIDADPTGRAWVIIGAQATLSVTAAYAVGMRSYVWTPNFQNLGTLSVNGVGGAVGVSTDLDLTIRNSGLTQVTATTGMAIGFDAEGFLINTGRLEVRGHSSVVGVDRMWSIENSGVIRALDDNPASDSIAVRMDTYQPKFVNTGTIEGDYSLVNTDTSGFGQNDIYDNRGLMIGKIRIAAGADLVNSGTIRGDVTLSRDADTYQGQQGVLVGVLHAGEGGDSLVGGAGADSLAGDAGNDTIMGGAGDDVLEGGRDFDLLDGGAGIDTVSYAAATMGVTLDLAAGRASASGDDTISGFERAIGGTFNDTMWGSVGADTLSGGDGQNYLRGVDGADSLVGGAAFDDMNGNMGDDTAAGGLGDDWVVGGKDNDLLFGDAGADLVYGNLGNDTCEGGDGNDIVRGGQGDDVVRAGAGADFVSGDLGNDTLTGGAGADTFNTFAETGVDRVTDFSIAEGDRVQLAPGTQYSVTQLGADAVISMTGGGQMILVGVTMSALTPGWIFGV